MFLLFAGDNYYPVGGWNDLITTYPTLNEAIAAVQAFELTSKYEWYHIVDQSQGVVVWENKLGAVG